MRNEFLTHLTTALGELLNEVLGQDGFALFRKAPRVVTGPFSPSAGDLHLSFGGYQVLQREGGTFRCQDSDGGVSVMRHPDRVQFQFILVAPPSAQAAMLTAWDRLMAFAFNHTHIDPILPESVRAVPGLFERLGQEKAAFALEFLPQASPADALRAKISYTALYHSGAVLNRESLVKQRVFEYRNPERSVP